MLDEWATTDIGCADAELPIPDPENTVRTRAVESVLIVKLVLEFAAISIEVVLLEVEVTVPSVQLNVPPTLFPADPVLVFVNPAPKIVPPDLRSDQL